MAPGSGQRQLAWFLVLALLLAGMVSVAQAQSVPGSRSEIALSFAPVVKQAAPAVVNIYTKRETRQRAVSPLFDDPFFKRFFGRSFGNLGTPRKRMENSLGSGVIVDPDGLVVTNYHVIKGATEITVVLADRRELAAEIVLADEDTDLTVLRVRTGGEKLPSITLRDSDSVEVGDLVLAIGNPFGVGQTVTSGIVSARARTQGGISDFSFFIQTDAAINPGNSGGALVTLDGKLLGINTAIYSRSGGSIGIGFAIPANMVRTVIHSAKTGDRLVRPWPGLVGQTVTRDLAEGFGLDRPGGVVVSQIYQGGPAAQAGLRKGDVILAVEDQPVENYEALRFRIATRTLGGKADLRVWRDKGLVDLKMPLMNAPETPPRNEKLLRGQHPLSGATAANLSPALAEELDLVGIWNGVILTGITRGTPAARLRFRPGDIILAIDRRDTAQVRDLEALLLNHPSRDWAITFRRKGRVRTLEVSG